MTVRTEAKTTTITVVSVPGNEYDRLKMKLWWLATTGLVLVVLGILLVPFFGWTCFGMGILFFFDHLHLPSVGREKTRS